MDRLNVMFLTLVILIIISEVVDIQNKNILLKSIESIRDECISPNAIQDSIFVDEYKDIDTLDRYYE